MHAPETPRRGTIVLLLLLALWIANRAIGPGNAEDSGLYHYRAIRWATAYPVVTGIGITALVGLFFGMYPAMRAAKLDPIEALRRE